MKDYADKSYLKTKKNSSTTAGLFYVVGAYAAIVSGVWAVLYVIQWAGN